MKQAMYVMVAVLLTTIVLADANVGVGITTPGDVNFDADIDAGGDVSVTIDGVNWDGERAELRTMITEHNGRGTDSFFAALSRIFLDKKVDTYEVVDLNDLTWMERHLRLVLEYYFVPRSEVDSRVRNLELEIAALQALHTKEELCTARMSVARDYGIESVTCGDTVWFNAGHNFISMEEPQIPIESGTPKKGFIKDMCEDGFEAYCFENNTVSWMK